VAKVPLERDDELPGADTLPEKDKAGDETLDVADPGNVPYPASAAGSGSGADGASFGGLRLQVPAAGAVPAAAVTGFSPGNIISNAVFTNKGTMSEASIRDFIDGKVAACQSGYTCLETYVETTPTRRADQYCAQYTGGTRETAARILYKVAQACGINPQVLLVMLQKEQGLVTHTWPSDWRFTIAMGMGCPDTADCDKTYYGFFNQVYGAARQLNIYGKSSYFSWYAPGGTRAIRYHPNASCGSSGVYVQNQATADLYYYTPYQPNAAALAAGMGTGDSCSSYGNRNFYNYFRTWFGSTGGGTAAPAAPAVKPLVKLGTAVWLVTGTRRYHVTPQAYPEYKREFGAPAVVTSATLSRYTDSGTAGLFVRNRATGVVAYLQGGQTHAFPSCDVVAHWGGSCEKGLVQLEAAQFTAFAAGSRMSDFARTTSGGRAYRISGTKLLPMYDVAAMRFYNGGATPYAAVMPAAVVENYTVSKRLMFVPGRFLTVTGRPEVWLPTSDGRLVYLPSWSIAADLGLPTTVGIRAKASDVAAYAKRDTLGTMIWCLGKRLFAGSGTLHQVTAAAPAGFPALGLDSTTCRELDLTGAKLATGVYIQAAGRPEVYRLEAGKIRHVRSYAQLVEFGHGKKPTIVRVQPGTLARFTKGTQYGPFVAGQFLTAGTGAVYIGVAETRKLVHLPHWAMAAEYGLPSSVGIRAAASEVTSYTRSGTLGWVANCGGKNYFAGGGRLHLLSRVPKGFTPVALGAKNCATLDRTGERITGDVFVQVAGTAPVYHLTGGVLRHVANPAQLVRLGGSKKPTIVKISQAGLGQFRMGARYSG
jgi:hypothetical protein